MILCLETMQEAFWISRYIILHSAPVRSMTLPSSVILWESASTSRF